MKHMTFANKKMQKKYKKELKKRKKDFLRKIERGEISRQTMPETHTGFYRGCGRGGSDLSDWTWFHGGLKISHVGGRWFVYTAFERGYRPF